MEITQKIISEQIVELKEHYDQLEEMFVEGEIPKCDKINATLECFCSIKPKKTYPDLKSKYECLKNYRDKTIYMFSVTDISGDVKSKFKEIKNEKTEKGKKILLPRENKKIDNIKSNGAICLYVGSSEKIEQRLKEHLFLYNKSTYAMHLEAWFNKNTLITIYLWDFSKLLENQDEKKKSEYLQNIEDLLWNKFKPLFGRQGKK